jgi:predicted protein tyrosine phosphatase
MSFERPHLIISPYQHVAAILRECNVSHVVSILGNSDRLAWPPTGSRKCLRLEFDDTNMGSGRRTSLSLEQIRELMAFASSWAGSGNLLIHCRAGTSRSPAAAAIALAAIGRVDLIDRALSAKPYYRPNRLMFELADPLISPTPQSRTESLGASGHSDGCRWGPRRDPNHPHGHRARSNLRCCVG